MRRFAGFWLFVLVIALTLPGYAREQVFIAPEALDISRLLAPPPAPDSQAGELEVQELLLLQASRTPEQVALAQADEDRSVFRFATVLGEGFSAERLPKTATLFEAVAKNASLLVRATKDIWKRPRPFTSHPQITPCLHKPKGYSYPSSHSTFGSLCAILLADMVPEKKAALFARGEQYVHNRMLGGVHYPSDVQGGRLAGTVIAAALFNDKVFMEQFAQAKAEVRAGLGLK